MKLLDFVLHIEKHIPKFIEEYGVWIYALLFLIIFCETGLVATPFLPGDSLLFAVGMFSAQKLIDLNFIFWLLLIAAISGDTMNYWIGYFVGPKVFRLEKSRWFNPKHLHKAHAFYEKHGGKAIILSRFVPIIRTFAPFVAGIATMQYRKFLIYNVTGGAAWISIFLFGGYFLGNLSWIQGNFKKVTLIIIFVSLLPILIEWLKARKETV